MKVSAISFNSGINFAPEPSVNRAFLYMPSPPESEIKYRPFMLTMLTAAAAAVLLTLINIKGPKKFSDKIVEITGENIGLNKIKNQSNAVKKIKEEFLYPVMAAMKGDKMYLNNTQTGIIIAGKDSRELLEALTEHAEKLNMNTESMTKNTRKYVYTTIAKAQEKYCETGKFTFVNLGKLDSFINMQVNKTTNSYIEEFLKSINIKDKPGIIWGAWTDNPNSVPYFFVREDVPVLITKTMD